MSSSSSYINDGNFRYGITEYDQPCIPQYNSTLHHKKRNLRNFPEDSIRDDGLPYQVITPTYSCCAKCGLCNQVNRDSLITSLVNIQSSIDKVLTIKLYAQNKYDDKVVKLRIGNKYCISYVTERGIERVTGVLRDISSNIPDECTKYIGNYTSVSTAAYIGIDCSSEGKSDKRLIYIASIRYIEEIFDNPTDEFKDLTQKERLELMLTKVTETISSIETYIENHTSESTEEDNSQSNNNQNIHNHNQWCFNRPGPYQGPLIVGQRHPYPPAGYGPGRPGVCNPPSPPEPVIQNNTSNTEEVPINKLVEQMTDIKTILSAFVTSYNGKDVASEVIDEQSSCNCCGNNDNTDTLDSSVYIEEDYNDILTP